MRLHKIVAPVCFVAVLSIACGFFGSAGGPYPVLKDGKWGYVDNRGKIVIEPKFQKAYDFSDGLALVYVNPSGKYDEGRFGFVDQSGNFVIEPQITWVAGPSSGYEQAKLEDKGFTDGLRIVTRGGKEICIDKTGKTVFELGDKRLSADFEGHFGYSDGLLLVTSREDGDLRDKSNFLDTSGKIAFKGDFGYADPFRDGIASVSEFGGGDRYIDTTGKTVFAGIYEKRLAFSEGLASFSEGGKFGFRDKTDKVVIEPKFDAAGDFHDGLAAVRKGAVWGYIDKAGKWAVQPKFSSALKPNDFSEGALLVFADGTYQVIDKTGETIAAVDPAVGSEPLTETIVGKFRGGLARIVSTLVDGEIRIVYVNKEGEVVWNEKGKVAKP